MTDTAIVGWAHTRSASSKRMSRVWSAGSRAGAAIEDAGIDAAEIDGVFVGMFNNGFSKQGFPRAQCRCSISMRCGSSRRRATRMRARPARRRSMAHAISWRPGAARFALVIGVEKMTATPGPQVGDALLGASYRKEEGDIPAGFAGVFGRIAERYFQQYGDQSDALAAIAAKNHKNGVDNPYAQMRRDLGYDFCRNVSEKNPYVAPPLKRTDCSLVSDGAAALIITDTETASTMGKAIRFRAASHVNDYLPLSRRDVTRFDGAAQAWAMALDQAGLTLADLSFAEVHDCFTIAELLAYEAMGLCAPGQGAPRDHGRRRRARRPVAGFNRSGGLKSKGTPGGCNGRVDARDRGDAAPWQRRRHATQAA